MKKWYLKLDYYVDNEGVVGDMFQYTKKPIDGAFEYSPGGYFHPEAIERSEKKGTMLLLKPMDIGRTELRKEMLNMGIIE